MALSRAFVLGFAVCVVASGGSAHALTFEHQVVVDTADPASGVSPSGDFVGFGFTTINAGGDVVFPSASTPVGAGSGLWSASPGSAGYSYGPAIAAGQQPAPNVGSTQPAGLFRGFNIPAVLNDGGDLVFYQQLQGPGINGGNFDGVWKYDSASGLELIARKSDPAIGGDAYRVTTAVPRLNNAGDVLFTGVLDSADALAVFTSGGGGTGVKHLQVGQQAPNFVPILNEDHRVTSIDPVQNYINDAGQIAVRTIVQDIIPTGGAFNGSVIYVGQSGSFQIAAKALDPVIPGVGVRGVDYLGGVNNSGQVAFYGGLLPYNGPSTMPIFTGTLPADRNEALISSASPNGLADTDLGIVVREGDPVPGMPGVIFGNDFNGLNVRFPVINDRGTTAFVADDLRGPGIITAGNENAASLWMDDSSGALHQIVRAGTPAVGLPAGATISAAGIGVGGRSAVLNNKDNVAFVATVAAGGGQATNTEALYFYDGQNNRNLTLVAYVGMPFELNGVTSPITEIFFQGGDVPFVSNSDGRRSGFNDNDQIVYAIALADGREAVVVSEPKTPTLIPIPLCNSFFFNALTQQWEQNCWTISGKGGATQRPSGSPVDPTMLLVTSSPSSMSQSLVVPDEPFLLEYEYLFGQEDGVLTVTLGDIVLDYLQASDLTDVFQVRQVVVNHPSLLGGEHELTFTFDSFSGDVAGLELYLANVAIPEPSSLVLGCIGALAVLRRGV
ncbi:DUF7453 family protein [Mucisphaera sp.]|uniref:DUF7453 family protein n=1 Tax=Mucisphaera sp. TaxID=2913024 RepID=UPI003D11FDB8